MLKAVFVTAIRSEYDIQYSVIKALREHGGFEAGLVVTGAHLSPMYGMTVREIEKDGFEIIARIGSLLNSDSPAGRVKSAAIQLASLVDILSNDPPDFLVAPFDREEALTVAVAGSYLKIPVVHIGGGDTADDGNVDNPVRHAVTKLAHLHMVATEGSGKRVAAMGEEPWRIHVVGAPGLDRLLSVPEVPDADFWPRFGGSRSGRPAVVVIQHSIISDVSESGGHMKTTLGALLGLDVDIFIGYPNSDAGSQRIIAVIEDYAARFPDRIVRYKNLPRADFVTLLRKAHALVGNSSCGIIEAPLLKLPVVNIGPRQVGREHASNVQFVEHDGPLISAAVRKAVFDEEYRLSVRKGSNPYGDGHAGERIARILAESPPAERLLKKTDSF